MCNTSLQHRAGFGDSSIEPLSFSTYHFLRNRFMIPPSDCQLYDGHTKENSFTQFEGNENANAGILKSFEELQASSEHSTKSPILDVIENISLPSPAVDTSDSRVAPHKYDEKDQHGTNRLSHRSSSSTTEKLNESELLQPTALIKSNDLSALRLPSLPNLPLFPVQSCGTLLPNAKSTLPGFEYIATANPAAPHNNDFALMELNRFGGVFPTFLHRRPRGEKRPIPEEQKDEKYYERRKRNNEAAKKSRDARKIREDRIAFRAALLEQENSILRAQILALRDELRAVRQLVNSSMATTIFPERANAAYEPVAR